MNKAELAEAISLRCDDTREPALVGSLATGFAQARRRVTTFLGAVLALALLRRAKPVRLLVLSASALAAGALGLVTAYAISPDKGSAVQVLVTNGTTYRIATVTGPGGTTTLAVTKTKKVLGPGRTRTDVIMEIRPTRVVVTDVRTETVRKVETQQMTVTQTETVVVTETVNVPPPP